MRLVEPEVLVEQSEDAPGHIQGLVRSPDAFEEDRELVAAETRRRVALPELPFEPIGDLDEQAVSEDVAVAVVDELEVVDVHEEHGDLASRSSTGQRVLHALLEQDAVRQSGESVVEGLVLEFVLEADALADVARGEHQAAHVRVVRAGWRPRSR